MRYRETEREMGIDSEREIDREGERQRERNRERERERQRKKRNTDNGSRRSRVPWSSHDIEKQTL